MDPSLLEKAIKERIAVTGRKPKAIIPVALYGMPYNEERIMEIANRYEIPVIEDAAEGFGSRWKGQVLGTFGKYGILSFNGNKMITTSGGGAMICQSAEDAQEIMWYATQAQDSYPYYQHSSIGYNYRMSNICAGIGRGQMTVADEHIAHHKHVQGLYRELLSDVEGVTLHEAPSADYDSNFWLCTVTLDPSLRVKGQEKAYKEVMRVFMLERHVEARPLWKPMHKQPVYKDAPAYVNGVSEELFKVGMCLPAGPCVTDEDVRYIVQCIKDAIEDK